MRLQLPDELTTLGRGSPKNKEVAVTDSPAEPANSASPPLEQRCSVRALSEPAAGSAARARCWVMLEQPGAWGRKAVTQSDLDPDLGQAIDATVAAAGGRFGLIREPNKRVSETGRTRVVLIAGGDPAKPWLLRGSVTDPAALLTLTPQALQTPTPAATLALLPRFVIAQDPVALVCTNGTRDLCCAIAGRPVASAAARERGGLVFETSHVGGHRFAPTGVLLPSGFTFARATADDVIAALDDAARGLTPAGFNNLAMNRGLAYLAPPAQVAVAAVQATLPAPPLEGWQAEIQEVAADAWHVTVTAPAGRRVVVEVTSTPGPQPRPASCGAKPEPFSLFRATILPED